METPVSTHKICPQIGRVLGAMLAILVVCSSCVSGIGNTEVSRAADAPVGLADADADPADVAEDLEQLIGELPDEATAEFQEALESADADAPTSKGEPEGKEEPPTSIDLEAAPPSPDQTGPDSFTALAKSVDGSTLTYDPVDYLTGDGAAKAFKEDNGVEMIGSDVYIRNIKKTNEEVTLTFDASMLMIHWATNCCELKSVDKDTFVKLVEGTHDEASGSPPLVWIRTRGGSVTSLSEIYTA